MRRYQYKRRIERDDWAKTNDSMNLVSVVFVVTIVFLLLDIFA